jgi:hypothetical protein
LADSPEVVEGAFAAKNLIGIPSYHYEPTFAQVAAHALAIFQPSIVALELPDGLIGELEWAAACWPGSVIAASEGVLFPFVPGDSIFESFRLARAARIPVVLVDLPAAKPVPIQPEVHVSLLGPELTRAGAGLFLEATDSLLSHTAPDRWSDAREAHMAGRLTRLLAQGEKVLWVGGMAHWTRIVARINDGGLDGPSVALTVYSCFERMRISPSALYRITGRLPWVVAGYARDPILYGEQAATQELCLEATKDLGKKTNVAVVSAGTKDLSALDEVEPSTSIDVVRTLQYARNLATTGGVRERPSFGELLTAAVATIGPKYAGCLYELAMNERASPLALEHEALEWEIVEGRERYRCGDRILGSRPWWPPKGGLLLSLREIQRRLHDELFRDLPAADANAKKCWESSPDDENDYASFVEYVLRRASLSDPEEAKSTPFRSGLRDGLDVRSTLRNWSEGTIYVREEQRGHLNFRNGAIDWINASEYSDHLTGKVPGGWIDPDLTRLGSCSRETVESEVLEEDPWIQRDHRDFSLVTLDAPTSVPTKTRGITAAGPTTFYDLVIRPLINLKNTPRDNLYGWLDVMFKFCAGKPFAYYSRYAPSSEIHRVAWHHKVLVVHFPFSRLPTKLIDRHKTFRFFGLTHQQWEEFQRRRSASVAPWPG